MNLPIGTKITCPDCKDHIADTRIEIIKGLPMSAHLFTFRNQVFVDGDKTECRKCEEYWFHYGRIHTENGWWPL